MKNYICCILVIVFFSFPSCGSDTKQNDSSKKKEIGIVEQKQHEIAQEAVKNMKDPIDKAKAVSDSESERLKNIDGTK